MRKIEIRNRYTDEVIYSCEAETMKESVEKAVKEKVDLSNSDLSNSDLRGSDLSNSDLSNSDLRGSNLIGSDLSNSDLRGSNLRGSNLRGSNLRGSNLRGSNLSNVIKLPMYCKWTHGITNGNLIHIGCEKRTIEEWDDFFKSNEVISTERGTQEFKQIQAVFEAYKAYLNFLKS